MKSDDDWWEWYQAYLRSDRWRVKREKVLARGRCEARWKGKRCQNAATQAHHLTYKRVGQERLEDLMAICSDCHRRIHRRKKRNAAQLLNERIK